MKEPDARERCREKLLEAAGEVFGEVGYKAATVREITKRAGMNLASVNYYFRDKEELYAAVLLHAQRCATASSWGWKNEGPAEVRLKNFVAGMLRHLLDPNRPAWHSQVMAREMANPTRMLHSLIDEGFRPKAAALEDIVQELADGTLSEMDLQHTCASIIGQCVFYRQNRPVVLHLYPNLIASQDHLDQLADHISSFSLGGIARLKSFTFSHVLL